MTGCGLKFISNALSYFPIRHAGAALRSAAVGKGETAKPIFRLLFAS